MTPSGWEVKKLNELCEINPKKPSKPSDELVSFISMSQVSEDGQIISTETKTYDEVSKGFTSFKDKDVLVAKITPCFENGKGALAHTLVNGIGFGSTEFHVLRAKENTDPKFIYYLTRTDAFRAKGTMNMQGSAGHRRVTTDFIQIYKINTPPLPEQQKIAKILTTWDKAISITEHLIENSTQQKKALMQQLLTGKKRLLDDEGERFEGEWEEAKLSKWLIEYKEKSTTQDQYDVYTSSRNGLVLQSDYFANSRIAGRDNIGFHVIPPNHITYRSRSDDGFFTFNLFSSDKNGLISNYYPVFSTKGINEFFIALFEQYRAVFGRYSVGTSQKVLSLNALKDISFKIPTLPEQQKIATVLTNADKEIELFEQQLADLQQEKKALMQVLLTGKKRVVVDEC